MITAFLVALASLRIGRNRVAQRSRADRTNYADMQPLRCVTLFTYIANRSTQRPTRFHTVCDDWFLRRTDKKEAYSQFLMQIEEAMRVSLGERALALHDKMAVFGPVMRDADKTVLTGLGAAADVPVQCMVV